MARPQRRIEPGDNPIAAFALDLSAMRLAADLTLKQLREQTHYSISALSEATNGKRLPTLELTRSYVLACGGDVLEWSRRWNAIAKAQSEGGGIAGPSLPLADTRESELPPSHRAPSGSAIAALRGLMSVCLLAVVMMFIMFAESEQTQAAPKDYAHPRFVTVLAGRVPTTSAARWYTSGVFLGAVCTLTGGIGVLGLLATSRALRARRLLTYRLVDTRPLEPREDAERLTWHAPRHAATTAVEPSVVKITVANRSRRDIPSRAFDQQRPLRLEVAAPVLEIRDVMSNPAGFGVPLLKPDGTAIALGPGLIKTRQTITFSAVIAHREPHLTVPDPSIIDTHFRKLGERRLTRVPTRISTMASIVLVASAGLMAAVAPRP